jgi:uncharacterized protein
MKFLVLLLVLAAAWLLWRQARLKGDGAKAADRKPPVLKQDMVQCPVCAVHLPRGDAVAGANGLMYCSPEHRSQAGQ